MKPTALKRSPEYEQRVRQYASGLAERYGTGVAAVFLSNVQAAERRIRDNGDIGVDVPYGFQGRELLLKEWHFDSGPAAYCLVYSIESDYNGLISLWHGQGSRNDGTLTRRWLKRTRTISKK